MAVSHANKEHSIVTIISFNFLELNPRDQPCLAQTLVAAAAAVTAKATTAAASVDPVRPAA